MDEKPIQLLDEIRDRISASPIHLDSDTQLPKPGYCEKIDSEKAVTKNRLVSTGNLLPRMPE